MIGGGVVPDNTLRTLRTQDMAQLWRPVYDEDGRCLTCNVRFTHDCPQDRGRHYRRHAHMLLSVHNARTQSVGDGVMESTPLSPVPVQAAAHTLGRRFSQECGSHGSPVSVTRFGVPDPESLERYCERSFIAVRDGWVVGVVVTRKRTQRCWRNPDGTVKAVDVGAVPAECWAIDAVYVVPELRRTGIARDTLLHAANVYGIGPSDFSWEGPLFTAGAGLAASFCGGGRVRMSHLGV